MASRHFLDGAATPPSKGGEFFSTFQTPPRLSEFRASENFTALVYQSIGRDEIPEYSMRKSSRLAVAVALICLVISGLWAYRVHAAREAGTYQPTSTGPILVPAGTAIPVVLNNGVRSSSVPGDEVVAFVPDAVIVNDKLVIQSGAQLRGTLEKLLRVDGWGKAYIRFTDLQVFNQSFPIQAQRVEVITPLQSDIAIVSNTLGALMGAGFGAAIGAATGDGRSVGVSMLQGATTSVFQEETTVPITVILTDDLQLHPHIEN